MSSDIIITQVSRNITRPGAWVGRPLAGSRTLARLSPISLAMSCPAKSEAKKTIRVTNPMSRPHKTSRVMRPTQSKSPRFAKGKGGRVGATSTASRAASAMRICTGTLSIVKMGRMVRNAPARTKTIIQLFKSQSTRSGHHLGHLLNDGGGEFDQLADHPGRQEQQHPKHAQRLGHEAEGLLVDGCDGLKEADDQADDHGHAQERRGQNDRLQD